MNRCLISDPPFTNLPIRILPKARRRPPWLSSLQVGGLFFGSGRRALGWPPACARVREPTSGSHFAILSSRCLFKLPR